MASSNIEKNRLTPIGSAGGRSLSAYIGVVSFFVLWGFLSFSGLVNSLILPSPLRVIEAIGDVGVTLFSHIIATTFRIIIGYVLGIFIGIILGVGMQYNRSMFLLFDGLIETFRPVPPVALVPFFILLFGFSELGKVFIVTIGVGLVIVVTTVEAIERVPVGILRWGLVCGLTRFNLFKNIILPSAWPEMRGGFRIALALAITLVIVSEFMGATYGLGYLINVSKITLTTPTILLCIIIIGWIGWALDRIVRLIFKKTCFWDIRAKEAIR